MQLECPTCKIVLTERSVGGETVDQCDACNGTWYDASELSSILRNTVGHASPDFPSAAPLSTILCPKCNVEISATIYANDSGIPICKCTSCKGVWLVEGQLEKIAHFKNAPHKTDGLAQAMVNSYAEDAWLNRYADLFRSRIYSLAFAAIILVIAFAGGGPGGLFRIFMYLFLPMVCIWFSEAMGNLTGIRLGLASPAITQATPGIAVAIGGWLLLFVVFGVTIYGAVAR